ncbi:hypothetical protein FMM80_05745 [Schaedlerella arabinosiphila]|uniref:Uncharacterized protein n=1 Tax=Schaedlerella arabinosiphila TaxID=2044587 RepID=A0A9X5C5Q7_9FIRM|nr:hypothetical protein [Schaedlerella arabinosiphila]KAI4443450.1 hypothetical protein C824_005985 [Schaedlerella arabinosiphila]MCI9603609.1 hypothetical protein [Ruminococcus sp.]MCI9634753.1 hypothetical protein [Ruminococcus sp.]NDO68236.1 hypothetical protein [Schaedlerella arabinosiphila]
MHLNEELLHYKTLTRPRPQEEKILETIRRSKEIFYMAEQEKLLSYYEFLWGQFQLIQKKWWLFQFLILCASAGLLSSAYDETYIHRGLGIMASMYIILIIPELWKNRTNRSMEIEYSSYYSLRQIYAARMVLFGIADTLLLTGFCGAAILGMHMAFTVLLVQFLLPMLITACICFGTLCSRHIRSEAASVCLCLLWCGLWLALNLDEALYAMVMPTVWLSCAGLALLFLCITVYRTLDRCRSYTL